MTKYFLILALLIPSFVNSFASAKNNSCSILCASEILGKDSIKEDPDKFPRREYFLKNGKSFIFIQSPENDYLVDLYIVGKGFPESIDTILFDEIEIIDSVIIADINNDGFEEIYVFTRGAAPGIYDHVFGITSDEDRSYKEINFYDVKPEDLKEGGILDGWLGQDVYTFENNLIKRTFPVYSPGDYYNNPSRGSRTLYYNLEKTDKGYFYKLKN